ncbi:MAG: fumarylacetoacetate hydrolase family protein [Sedimentisphaerales bacterium]|nr:fumarylacetoacetate hydrolase family protein [Sedimentisphaerales bacterium]
MKLAAFSNKGKICFGLVTDAGIIEINEGRPISIKEILCHGREYLEELNSLAQSATEIIPIDKVKILPPIPRPGKILALAGNYAKHIIEGGMKLGLSETPRETTVPRPFIMPATAVIGDGDTIPWPAYSEQVDYEVELAVVIGKKARCVPTGRDEALDCVAGYTIVNDVSARSVTFKKDRKERPWDEFFDWLNGKWSDGFCPMGPYLVTKDEIEDVQNLNMELKVNGETRQKANTSQMIHQVKDIISFISHLMVLEPGDIIATGTPSGVGMADGRFLEPGDVIECSIEKIGTLTNTVGERPQRFYEPLKK